MSTAAALPIPQPTQTRTLDELVARLKDGAKAFVRLSMDQRIALAESMREGYHQVAKESVVAACKAKGIAPDSPLAGEEWLGGPMVTLRNLRLIVQALRDIQREGAPHVDPSWLKTLPDGRLAIKVFPTNGLDAMLLAKHEAWVHMEPGITAQNFKERQAGFYKKPHGGKLCVVLGAGNVNAIPPTDVVYKMFVEGTVCILKMNPVNAYVGPFVERAFRAAIDQGFFAVVYGGAEEGGYLVNHPQVDEVHITGSDKTHDVMVWGAPGPEREARKKRHDPLLKKDISSELGNVSPVIVVPGPYSDGELGYQADNVAGMVCNNGSFNCNSAKLLVTQKTWNRRGAFVARVEEGLAKGSLRKAYYPGAEQRWKEFTQGRPGLKIVGKAAPGELPYALIPDVDPSRLDDRVFNQEPWCAILSETGLPGADAASFLDGAVKFVNEKVWGTLCVTLVVHPKSFKDPVLGPALEKAIRELRYGSVVVNTWAGAVFGLASAPWGGHPSSTLEDIQSGRGWVHNTFMFDGIEKCVLTAPVKAFPVAPWFPGHRTVHQVAQKLVELEYDPSWLKVPGIATAAMRA